jgi:agmatine/peptidylarginine deiminase
MATAIPLMAASSVGSLAAAGRPRVPAEWEPALGALVAWPPIVPEALLVEIARDDRLFLMVADDRARSEAEAALGKLKIDPAKVRFIVAPAGDARSWPRDWGPFPLFDEEGAFHLADPRFIDYPGSTPGCDGRLYAQRVLSLADFRADDAATETVARTLGLSRVQLPFALTGGNALVDGLGTAFSTCVMLNENRRWLGIKEDELRRLVADRLGITSHVIIPNFEWFGIQHIDCLLKPLNEETLLVKRVPARHPDHEAIEAIVRRLASLTDPRGRPYRILRIETPPYLLDYFVANYTNSLILNRKILVPLFGIPADRAALETWRQAMPGYEVIGFENRGREGWNWLDALHCRVRAVWDPEMLSMSHRHLDDPAGPAPSYRIEVAIRDHSRAGLVAGELKLWWRLRGEAGWNAIRLEPAPGETMHAAAIPSPGPGRTIEYSLAAADRSGRRETLPRVAPAGFYSFAAAAVE